MAGICWWYVCLLFVRRKILRLYLVSTAILYAEDSHVITMASACRDARFCVSRGGICKEEWRGYAGVSCVFCLWDARFCVSTWLVYQCCMHAAMFRRIPGTNMCYVPLPRNIHPTSTPHVRVICKRTALWPQIRWFSMILLTRCLSIFYIICHRKTGSVTLPNGLFSFVKRAFRDDGKASSVVWNTLSCNAEQPFPRCAYGWTAVRSVRNVAIKGIIAPFGRVSGVLPFLFRWFVLSWFFTSGFVQSRKTASVSGALPVVLPPGIEPGSKV